MVFQLLRDTKTIWFTFWLTIGLTISFGIIMLVWDFILIDEMHDSEQITNHIANLTPVQRQAHIWMTSTIDVLYPFAYASFFIGVALKAFPGRTGALLALPSLLCIPVDLTEGYSQVMLLSDHGEYMGLKTTMTPIKFVLFVAGMLIAIVGVVKLKYYPTVEDPKVRQD